MQATYSDIVSIPAPPATTARNSSDQERVTLWRLHSASDDLVCVAVVTSYGYALSLELAGEPILLELQRCLEQLVCKANRLEAWLLTQGWQVANAD